MARRILYLSASLLVIGACSSSSSGSARDADVTTPVASSATTPPPATLAGPVEPAGPDDPYCVALASVQQLDGVQQLAGADPGDIQAAVDVASAALAQVSSAAPAEVRADWATLASVYGELFAAYRGSGFDLTALMTDPSASGVFEHLGAREVLDAGDRVEQHAEAACGVSLGLGRSIATDEPELAATDTTTQDPSLSDADAAELGRRLLDQFAVPATPEQQTCVGRAISDPAITASNEARPGDSLERLRELTSACGIDTTSIG